MRDCSLSGRWFGMCFINPRTLSKIRDSFHFSNKYINIHVGPFRDHYRKKNKAAGIRESFRKYRLIFINSQFDPLPVLLRSLSTQRYHNSRALQTTSCLENQKRTRNSRKPFVYMSYSNTYFPNMNATLKKNFSVKSLVLVYKTQLTSV